jgi:hypothetical protein
MASETTLNAKNLALLGVDRLAELLLELATGDAAAKRRLRLELVGRSGGSGVAAEVRKRLASIAKSRSFLDWRKVKPLAQDLEMQRTAVMAHVSPTRPAEAFELLWRLIDLAPSIYGRCDDSNGTIGTIIALARTDLGGIAAQAKLDPHDLAERVFVGVCSNDYGQFDGLIALVADALGHEGLDLLKTKFQELAAKRPAKPSGANHRVIGIGPRGPIFESDYEANRETRLVQKALTQIADALGDVDGYAASFSADDCANPAVAAQIAERLLSANRAPEAMAALRLAENTFRQGGYWPDWQRVWIDTLDGLGRSAEAQETRWAVFERSLNAGYLRAHLKRLPDFDDEEAEIRALAHVAQSKGVHQALAFFIDWPAHARASELVLTRHRELDGDQYGLLTYAAETLDEKHPLAATLVLRSMITFSLERAKHSRYGHAARHLQTCEYLAKRIEDFGGHVDHQAFVAGLKSRHGRKTGFWNA